MFLTRKAKRQC